MKTTNILLGILIIAVIVVGFLMLNKPATPAPVVYTNTPALNQPTQTSPVTNTQQPPTPVVKNTANSGWTTASANGMSISMPPGYSQNTGLPAALEGKGTSLNIAYNNTLVVGILKFSDQGMFNESVPQGSNSDYTLVNSNYPVSGLVGKYYRSLDPSSGEGDLIIVPSKLVIISIAPLSYSGISQTTLDQIISSIKL